MVRHDQGRRGQRGGVGDHRQVLARHISQGADVLPRHAGLRRGLEVDGRCRGEIQRARQVHRLHRLRVDLAGAARQQPAPGGDLPRWRRQGGPGRAVHHLSARRQHDAGRPVEGVAGLPGQDRRPGAGDRPQRQPVERHDVPVGHQPGQQGAADARVRANAHQLGAAVRGDPDQGRRRGARLPFQERRVRRLRDLGQGQPQPERAQEERDAAGRVRAHGAADRSAARAEAGRESVQVRHDRFDRLAHLARHGRRQQLLRQEHARRAEREALRTSLHEDQARHDHGLGADRVRLRRGLGHGQHPRRPVGCDEAQGNLRHHRAAHDRALLRRLGFRRGRC